jgi:hypothetical protein
MSCELVRLLVSLPANRCLCYPEGKEGQKGEKEGQESQKGEEKQGIRDVICFAMTTMLFAAAIVQRYCAESPYLFRL